MTPKGMKKTQIRVKMGKHIPLVSVVIPAFNAELFIGETIDSVLAQTYPAYEVIVVDDGSSDRTRELVTERFGTRVRLVVQENQGPSAARNAGAAAARGDYLAVIDADDIWLPKKLSGQVEILKQNPDIGFLCGNMVEFDDTSRDEQDHFSKRGLTQEYFGHAVYVKDAFRKLFFKNFISTSTVLMRTSVFRDSGGFDPSFRFSEDYLLWLRISRITCLGYQPDVWTLKRKHSFNLTNDIGVNVKIRPRVLDQIMKEHSDYIALKNINVSQRYAYAYFQLGRWRLYMDRNPRVSQNFLRSLRYRLSFRTALYFVLTTMGLGPLLIRVRPLIRNSQLN